MSATMHTQSQSMACRRAVTTMNIAVVTETDLRKVRLTFHSISSVYDHLSLVSHLSAATTIFFSVVKGVVL